MTRVGLSFMRWAHVWLNKSEYRIDCIKFRLTPIKSVLLIQNVAVIAVQKKQASDCSHGGDCQRIGDRDVRRLVEWIEAVAHKASDMHDRIEPQII